MGKEVKFTTKLPAAKLELNEGQLDGLPTNPRYIKDEKFAKLKLSLERSPEFLEANPLKVYPLNNGNYIIIGGNMRFLAGKEIGIKEFPCYIFAKETTTEKLKEFLIKDNVAYGNTDWDSLANNDWNVDDLDEWGMDVDFLKGSEVDFNDVEEISEKNYEQPKTEMLVCPNCHHQDFAIHFQKVKVDSNQTRQDSENENEIEPLEDSVF